MLYAFWSKTCLLRVLDQRYPEPRFPWTYSNNSSFDYILRYQFKPICSLSKQSVFYIKGTVSVITSDPSCKDGNFRFATVPLKALSDQVWIIYQCLYNIKNWVFSAVLSLQKWLAHFHYRKRNRNYQNYQLKVLRVLFMQKAFPSLHGG